MDAEKGTLVTKLRRVKSVFDESRWSFTSHRLLNTGMMSNYSNDALRMIRNEIYARKGLQFKSKDLATYFGEQAWYKPIYTDVSEVTLTPIEQMNVKIIRILEEDPSFNYTETEK